MFLYYCEKKKTVRQHDGGGRELRHIQMVYGVWCSVYKTAMERTRRHIWDSDIIVGM